MTQRADEIAPASTDQAVVLAYFTLLMKRDLDAFEALWHPDAVQEIPFKPEGFGAFVTDAFTGRDEIMAHYRVAFANRRDHVFWIDEIHTTSKPGCVIVEAHARSLVGETGKVYENSYVCIFQVRDGQLARLKEYVNPLAFMKAFGGGFDAHR
jgi:ketosteroid isomerase-like protein